jgi:hypothetical protein
LAALSGLLSRLLLLLTRFLLAAALLAALSGLLVRLLGLLPALIWIILSHKLSPISGGSIYLSRVAAKARDVEKET